jgi:hypothetical protein
VQFVADNVVAVVCVIAAKFAPVIVEFVMLKTEAFIITGPWVAANDEPKSTEFVIVTMPPLLRTHGLLLYPPFNVQFESVRLPLETIIKSDWSRPVTAFKVQFVNE